jgi:hypothetical protein
LVSKIISMMLTGASHNPYIYLATGRRELSPHAQVDRLKLDLTLTSALRQQRMEERHFTLDLRRLPVRQTLLIMTTA